MGRGPLPRALRLYLLCLAHPGARDFFELTTPGAGAVLATIVGAGLAIVGLWLTDERLVPRWPRR
jgi:hypothetical protein